VKSIESYIKKNHKDKQNTVTEIKRNDNNLTAGEQFIRQNGIVIMTENASTISDEVKKYSKKTSQDHRITKIK
jgi:hypothetical protein